MLSEKANYPVVRMCDWLHINRASFYAWCSRTTASGRARRRVTLAGLVRASFDASGGTYGARRVAASLRRGGQPVSVRLVAELMAEQDLVACQPRPFRATTRRDPAAPQGVPDLLERDWPPAPAGVTATAPGTTLVGDITYVPTWTGFWYFATVIDCYSRKVVGWAGDTHLRTSLVIRALDMAAGTGRLAPDAIFHSDRGTQYTSRQFAAHLNELDLRASMGRTGICWDNALAESFFGALKNELVHRTAFPTPEHARRAIVTWVEGHYNQRRLHSALGYKTPAEVEAEHYQNLHAA